MFLTLVNIAGSLALFLYGMKVMSDGIQKAAGDKLRSILAYVTDNRFAAVFTGFAITSIIQSSSATTVMVVSFVNAGLLSLIQAIGVIMGANIGTTVTGWIVALLGFKVKIYNFALPAIGLGMILLFVRRIGKRNWGEGIVGFGLLFLGLKFLKDSVPDISQNPKILEFLNAYTGKGFLSFIIFVLAGTIITCIVQSSSATMAITLTMAYSGWIDFPTAAALVLGENIGTTITANIASVDTSTNARRAARIHTLFNVMGVLWMAVVFTPFLRLVDLIVPGEIMGVGGHGAGGSEASGSEAGSITAHLAMFHTLFNLTNTLLFIGFVPHLARLIEWIVKDKQAAAPNAYQLKYVATSLQDTPEFNILNARCEIQRMARITEEMFTIFLDVFNHPKKKMGTEIEQLKTMEDYTDQMQEEISKYLVECMRENLTRQSADSINIMIRILDELESIGDRCYNLILLAQRRYDKKIVFSPKAIEEITPYARAVQSFLEFNRLHLKDHLDRTDISMAYKLEDEINNLRNTLKRHAQRRIKRGANVKAEILYIDILRQIERIGDFSLSISKALLDMR
ncbi:MAG TPA: Na/Pi cotransporter family protein [Spirochaetia bacterium]|nr:Na/Pi cotransporter family protein [Spirochaetia bacterium]